MKENEVIALVRGMAPRIHEIVADAVNKATVVPPELAEQVASAVRLLHESPPIVQRNETLRAAPPARVARIERDDEGNLVPIYDEPQKVIIELSEDAGNVMLDALSELMNGGSIELLTSDSKVLAVLKLANPAAGDAVGGELVLNKIAEEDAALAQGNAMSARILALDGSEVFSCDVGDENSDAVIKLNTTKIYRGGPVRLRSFRLVMP